MKDTTKRRGRPRKGSPMTAAERMRAYRKRKRDAGLKIVRRWESVEGADGRQYSDHRILDARNTGAQSHLSPALSVGNSS